MSGVFTGPSEESFRTIEEITLNRLGKPKKTFEIPNGLTAAKWFEEADNRQEFKRETDDVYDYAKIEVESNRPVAIGITGDWHLGSDINLEMLNRDIDIATNHPFVGGIILTGDLTDSAFFNPAQDEDYFSLGEQDKWLLSILDGIGKDKLLAMWKGNHDFKWEKARGVSKYEGFRKRYDCPIFYGNAYIEMIINNIPYYLMGSHRLRGNSIYNNAHPAVRGHREVQGVDVVFCGHTHKKGKLEQAVREFGGARKVYALVNGTYQIGSGFAKDSGFGTQKDPEQGMWWLILNHDKKMIRTCDTEEMLETMAQYIK